MKRFLLLLFLISGHITHAQDTTFSRVINIDTFTAETIYRYAKSFCSDKEKLFVTEKDLKNRRWALGRAKWASTTPILTGIELADETNKQIVAKFVFAYQRHGATVNFLAIYGDVIIKCKDGKTRIELANITYAHVDNESPPTFEKITDGNKFCNMTGTMRDLINCKAAPKTMADVMRFINEAATGIMDGYEAYLKTTLSTEDW